MEKLLYGILSHGREKSAVPVAIAYDVTAECTDAAGAADAGSAVARTPALVGQSVAFPTTGAPDACWHRNTRRN